MTLFFKVTGRYLELVTKLSKKRVEPAPSMRSAVSALMDLCNEWSEKLSTIF